MDSSVTIFAELTSRFWAFLGFSVFILVTAILMLALHVQSWRNTNTSKLSGADYDFAWRRYRRRMQTSGMLVSLSVFLFLGQFVERPLLALFYWAGVLIMIVWVMLLAMLDLFSSRRHYSKLAHNYRIEQARLKSELKSLQEDRPTDSTQG